MNHIFYSCGSIVIICIQKMAFAKTPSSSHQDSAVVNLDNGISRQRGTIKFGKKLACTGIHDHHYTAQRKSRNSEIQNEVQ